MPGTDAEDVVSADAGAIPLLRDDTGKTGPGAAGRFNIGLGAGAPSGRVVGTVPGFPAWPDTPV
jgi:hypothetical protein